MKLIQGEIPTQKWRYAWRGKRLETTFGVLLMTFGTVVTFFSLIAPFGVLGSTAQSRMLDFVPIYVPMILLIFCIFVLAISLVEKEQYARTYETNQKTIAQISCFFRAKIRWIDVIEVNRLIEPTRDAYMAFVNRRGLWIASRTDWMIVYEELEGYEEFCALVNAQCKARGVPMFERDSSWEVVGVKGRGLWAKHAERRGRLTRYEIRPIDEL